MDPRAADPSSGFSVAQWHPGWLGIVLGTGGAAVASLVDPLPFTRIDDGVGALLTAIAVVLLPVLAVPYLLRLRRHRQNLLADLAHPGLGAMFGTLPASLLITAVALTQLALIGWLPAATTAWVGLALLLAGAVGAVLVGVEFFSRVVAHEQVPPAALTGAWFIPIVVLVLVPSVVARLAVLQPGWATSSAVLASAAAWGAGLLLFLLLAPVLAWRLVTSPPPPSLQAATWWIWLAPAGAGGLGVLALARLTAHVVGGPAVPWLETSGLLAATALWGFGTWWALFAGRILLTTTRDSDGLPFHLGSWGFAFPTAAMTALTVELGRSWSSPVVSAIGAFGWLAVLLVWGRLAGQTVAGVRSGSIYHR